MIEKNAEITLRIESLSDEGHGVGRHDGQVIFVPGALPGETVHILIVKVLKSYAFGKIINILEQSPDRVPPECPHFRQCGGCSFWHTTYTAELAFKRRKVSDCIARIGKIEIDVPEVLAAPFTQNYRNKAQFPVTPDGIGMFAPHSHRLVPMRNCLIQSKQTAGILNTVAEWASDCGISPYDETTHSGNLRHIYTRIGLQETVVCLVTLKNLPSNAVKEIIARLQNLPNIVGITQNINPHHSNAVLGPKTRVLFGHDHIFDAIGDLIFKVSMNSFYQVNSTQTLTLYNTARDMLRLTGQETIWDLYCGIGTIGLFMAKNAKRIIGVESVKQAVEDARNNADLNKITNADFHLGKVEEIAEKLTTPPDIVILDPPRKGCDPKLLMTLANIRPQRILYISCKPSTLARDLAVLHENGFVTTKIQPLDMFPRTPHIETIALLEKTY